MAREVMLSTADNPFDPFKNFREWNAFDEQNGYNSCAYLARIAKTSSDLSEADYNFEVEQAIDSIVKLNLTGNYIKVVKET